MWPGILQIPFYRGFFKNEKGPGTSFQAKFFARFCDKKLSFIIHKLVKFHF